MHKKGILKNSFGVSYQMALKPEYVEKLDTYGGSSLNRKKKEKKESLALVNPLVEEQKKKAKKVREQEEPKKRENVLSSRSKSKIRAKIQALSGVLPHLVFVTLTFQNQCADRLAVQILKRFLNNVRKRKPEFEYLWILEKQTKNKVFKNNIHAHLVTNIYWKIDRWFAYWLEVQKKFGVVPRESTFKASSGFDVKRIKSSNHRQIGGYLAGYLNKQEETFDCPVWQCSKRVSRLYTSFYSGVSFLDQLRRLEESGHLGGKIKTIVKEWCAIHLIPRNQRTDRFYDCIHEVNKALWQAGEKEKQHATA